MTLPLLIAKKARDKRYPWAMIEGDPDAVLEAMAEAADIRGNEALSPVERLWLIVKGEASPTEEDLSGLASAFEMDIEEVIAIAEGRGPLINGDVSTHVKQH